MAGREPDGIDGLSANAGQASGARQQINFRFRTASGTGRGAHLMFAALMIGVQRAISLFTREASACWPRLALSGISKPRSSNRLRELSSSSALSSASASLSRVGFGVPLGENRASQPDTWNFGSPASFEVGTFGRTGLRCSAPIAYALIAPLRTYGKERLTPPSHM